MTAFEVGHPKCGTIPGDPIIDDADLFADRPTTSLLSSAHEGCNHSRGVAVEAGHDTSELEMVVLMTPDMANFSGKVEGGALLNLLDRVAFSCASRFSQEYAVTLSS